MIAEACAEVGVRVVCAYGVTDRHGADGARRGLAENERFLRAGGRGMVGVHAAFTCTDDTLAAAAGLAADLGVGVHIHVAEGPEDAGAGERLRPLAADDWLLVHCVGLDRTLPGTIAHNPRSNMNNGVGYARPARRPNDVVLGTDGIGADMLEEFRLAYVAHRADDVTAVPDTAWSWLTNGYRFVPEAADDRVDVDLRPRRLAVARRLHAGDARHRRRQRRRRGARRRRPPDARRPRRGPRPRRRAGGPPVRPPLSLPRLRGPWRSTPWSWENSTRFPSGSRSMQMYPTGGGRSIAAIARLPSASPRRAISSTSARSGSSMPRWANGRERLQR